ncbi:GRIP and coiled-coil domain-containing protein 2 [Orchesella cincta]|uniref:GRIP and coiled-coil domain-containing protein 2 n=1 Tax=Orchesella cincta TaxID=48709 RepID=A0A1D2MV73_ORCCI|nr:GRIP and coiled-coil domain-containing protein 2 [Orchesella cincta]
MWSTVKEQNFNIQSMEEPPNPPPPESTDESSKPGDVAVPPTPTTTTPLNTSTMSVDDGMEERYNKLKAIATSEDSSKIQNLTLSHILLREKVEKLEKDLVELEQWKSRAENLGRELKEAKETETNAEQEKRQSAILSLEVTDYEKKLQESHKQLEEKKAEVEALRKDLSQRGGIVEELEKKLQNFKDTQEQLTRSKESLQADIQRKLEKIQFLQDEMNKTKEKLSEKNLEYIKLEQEYENSKLAFSSQSRELVEKCDSLQRMIATLEHKISVLEENKRSRESHIANLKLEIQQLESEYTNYKTKAQAMLKSQRPVTVEQQSDELENLQKMIQNFQSDVSILKTDLQTLQLENENLVTEKSELGLRLNQVKADAIEKEIRLNNDLQKAKQELRQREDLLKLQLDEMNVAKCAAIAASQANMESLKAKYENQILLLQEQVNNVGAFEIKDSGISNADSIPSRASAFRPVVVDGAPLSVPDCGNSGSESDGLYDHHTQLTQPLAIDTGNLSFEQLRMIPRGECEGSESVSSAFTPRVSVDNYMTFEQLLSSSLDSASKSGLDGDLEKSRDGVNFKEELVRSQNQVSHLTALLRESESNCERLTQLSEALKEEIRRVEREKERKEHLKENTEYLKNVLLKFVTLSGEDERRRLIPVLKTMLQLTNSEVLRLENSVKGKDSSGQSNEGKGAGWSSYLSLFSNEK